jgi:hypothetical protein
MLCTRVSLKINRDIQYNNTQQAILIENITNERNELQSRIFNEGISKMMVESND